MTIRIHRVTSLPVTPIAGDYYLLKSKTGILIYAAKTDGTGYLRLARKVKVSGPTALFPTEVGTYTIKDYTDQLSYVITSTDGVVIHNGDTFTFVCSDSAKTTADIILNGRKLTVTIKKVIVNAPTIQAPVDNATAVPPNDVTITASPMTLNFSGASDTLVSADWEISTDPTFATVDVASYNDTKNLLSWKPLI